VPEILDRSVLDEVEVVSDAESFATVRRLVREEGLLVGGSAGTAVAAALRVARRVLDPVVVLLPDGWDRYRTRPWMAKALPPAVDAP
jgi:cysteine synthase